MMTQYDIIKEHTLLAMHDLCIQNYSSEELHKAMWLGPFYLIHILFRLVITFNIWPPSGYRCKILLMIVVSGGA